MNKVVFRSKSEDIFDFHISQVTECCKHNIDNPDLVGGLVNTNYRLQNCPRARAVTNGPVGNIFPEVRVRLAYTQAAGYLNKALIKIFNFINYK